MHCLWYCVTYQIWGMRDGKARPTRGFHQCLKLIILIVDVHGWEDVYIISQSNYVWKSYTYVKIWNLNSIFAFINIIPSMKCYIFWLFFSILVFILSQQISPGMRMHSFPDTPDQMLTLITLRFLVSNAESVIGYFRFYISHVKH